MGTITFVARHIPRRGQPLGQPTPRERIARGLHVRAVTAAGVGAALAWVGQLDIGSMLLKGATVLAMAAAAVAIDEDLRPMGTERGRAGS